MKTSIIIPTYNRAGLLERAVQSIEKEAPVEIIIVDDASTDNTKQVVEKLKIQDPRIVFIALEQNRGVNAARNAGIRAATTDWIQMLDSDDAFVSGGARYVSTYLDTVIDPKVGVVGFMTLREVDGVMEPRGYRVGEKWKTASPTYEDITLKKHIKGDIHYCLRRSIFAQHSFFEGTRAFEMEFFALIAKRGVQFLYVNEVVDQRYSDPGYHLSDEPFKRWPREFARAYQRFLREHHEILQKHPQLLRHYTLRTAKCLCAVGDVRCVWWFAKAILS